MTPCEELGYKVGDEFKVVGNEMLGASRGDIITLIEDDKTESPYFSGKCFGENGDIAHSYYYLVDLKKITPDEWIEWRGGECPVLKGTLVDVEYRDGVKEYSLPAGVSTIYAIGRNAHQAYWDNDGMEGDIVAYRPSDTTSSGSADKEETFVSGEIKTTNNPNPLEIVGLISSVTPNVSVGDALRIANLLIENGFKQ